MDAAIDRGLPPPVVIAFLGFSTVRLIKNTENNNCSLLRTSMGHSTKKNPVIHALERLIEDLPDCYENWWWHSKTLHQFLLEKGVRQSLTEVKVRCALSNLSRHGFLTENSFRTLKYYKVASSAWDDNTSPKDQQGKVPKLPPTRDILLPQATLDLLNTALEEMEQQSKQCTIHDVVTMVRVRSIPSNIVSPM
jgi:hypothetical protein